MNWTPASTGGQAQRFSSTPARRQALTTSARSSERAGDVVLPPARRCGRVPAGRAQNARHERAHAGAVGQRR
jgi:hypothetical protein